MNAITPIQSASSTLAARAMLVSLSISQWSGRRLDKAVTSELNASKGAADDASRVNKLLLPPSALAGIQAVVSETRLGFYERTLPWLNDGSRIIAADGYLPMTAWLRGQQRKFESEVDKLANDFDQHVTDAQRRMGNLFKASDYPTTHEVRQKFAIEFSVLPVPTSADFRVQMADVQAERIRAEIEANLAKATEAAIGDVYRRVAEMVERMAEKLPAYRPAKGKGDRAEGIFRDSIVENIRDLIDVMPSLNIIGSPELDALGDQLKTLVQWDAAVLREDEGKRLDVASQAQAILDSVSDYLR